MPDALLNAGYTRLSICLRQEVGLVHRAFCHAGGGGEFSLNGDVMAPFAFDGGVGASSTVASGTASANSCPDYEAATVRFLLFLGERRTP